MDDNAIAALKQVSTASLTTVLYKKNLRNVWIRNARPIRTGLPRVVGPAFTLRFVPGREDISTPASGPSPITTRAAIEDMAQGVIVVADAMGISDAGIVGDILCLRMAMRGVAGLVTDGVIRDAAGVHATHLPIWCNGIAAPAPVGVLTFAGWQETIGCGGVAVVPGDIVVIDDDGAVVIPQALLDEVLREAPEQEALEAWTMAEVARGVPLPGLYPMNEENRLRYAADKAHT